MKYLSPTSFNLFRRDRHGFYKRYLADSPIWNQNAFKQNAAMAVGSAFDCLVKNKFNEALLGKATNFEPNVEPGFKEIARVGGEECLDLYVSSGAFHELVELMKTSKLTPRFEFDAAGLVEGEVPIFGKPDCYFLTNTDMPVMLEFKINGYGTSANTRQHSPIKHFWKCRNEKGKRTKDGAAYTSMHGVDVSVITRLEEVHADWAVQLTMYSWMIQGKCDHRLVGAVEQLLFNQSKKDGVLARSKEVVSGRYLLSKTFAERLRDEVLETWRTIDSGWIFRDLPKEQSQKYQELYDKGIDPRSEEEQER